MPEISLIIVTFNSSNFIKSCLDSIFIQWLEGFEVIVVDNGSKDDTVKLIKKDYAQVNLIENERNFGACRARNQGIYVSKGKWVLCLDCDTVLEKGFLDNIKKSTGAATSSIGIFQPKILRPDKNTIYSCGIYLSRMRRFYDIGKGKLDKGQFDNMRYIFGACSAAALYRREMLEEIRDNNGYFDERFFFLVEDVDLSWRAQKKDWKSVFCPEIICYHNGNSSGANKIYRKYFCFRNRLLSISKNENFFGKIRLIPVFFIYDLPRWLLLCCRSSILRKESQW
jgi:GT2 family glycosyltransferase